MSNRKITNAVREVIRDVDWAVCRAVDDAVYGAVIRDVDDAVYGAVDDAVYYAVYLAVDDAVDRQLRKGGSP